MMRYGPLMAIFLVASCGVPEKDLVVEMDFLDRAFHEPAVPSESESLLKKEELTLEDVLRLAELLNPDLESLRKDIDLAPLASWNESLYPNPTFNLEVEEFSVEEKRSLGAAERGFGIGQSIPISGRLGAAKSVSEMERRVAALRYLWERRVILTSVKQAFLGYLAARENVKLTRQTRDLAKQFHDLTQARFDGQAIPEMELLKAAVNLAKAGADVRTSESALSVRLTQVHALVGNVDFPVERLSGVLNDRFEVPSLETLRGQVVVAHPRIEAARGEKELAERVLDLEKTRWVPDLDVDLALKWGPDENRFVELGVSVPLPLFNHNQAGVAAAEIRIRKAELKLQGVKNEALLALTEAYRRFTAAQDRVETYRDTILPKATKALLQTNQGYKAGKFTYLDVLDAQQTLAEARQAYLSALEDLNNQGASLERVTGSIVAGVR